MRLSVSNIGWAGPPDDPITLARLRAAGCEGVDIAPTRLWPGWEGMSVASAREFKRRFADAGLQVPGVQSLFYGLEAPALFDDARRRAALEEHLRSLAEPLSALGARCLVFGSPKLRDRGARSLDEATSIARDCFGRIARSLHPYGLVLCIEPNPPQYGCGFVHTAAEAAALVGAVQEPGFGLHLDSGAASLAGEDPAATFAEHGALACHAHASEPWLASLVAPTVDHLATGAALRASGYQGWVSLELRATDPEALRSSLTLFARAYGGEPEQ